MCPEWLDQEIMSSAKYIDSYLSVVLALCRQVPGDFSEKLEGHKPLIDN